MPNGGIYSALDRPRPKEHGDILWVLFGIMGMDLHKIEKACSKCQIPSRARSGAYDASTWTRLAPPPLLPSWLHHPSVSSYFFGSRGLHISFSATYIFASTIINQFDILAGT